MGSLWSAPHMPQSCSDEIRGPFSAIFASSKCKAGLCLGKAGLRAWVEYSLQDSTWPFPLQDISPSCRFNDEEVCTCPDTSVIQQFSSVPWNSFNRGVLKSLYGFAPISVHCNKSSAIRFPVCIVNRENEQIIWPNTRSQNPQTLHFNRECHNTLLFLPLLILAFLGFNHWSSKAELMIPQILKWFNDALYCLPQSYS